MKLLSGILSTLAAGFGILGPHAAPNAIAIELNRQSAMSVTAEMPSQRLAANESLTVPVTIHNAAAPGLAQISLSAPSRAEQTPEIGVARCSNEWAAERTDDSSADNAGADVNGVIWTCPGRYTTVVSSRSFSGQSAAMTDLAALELGGTDHLLLTFRAPGHTGPQGVSIEGSFTIAALSR